MNREEIIANLIEFAARAYKADASKINEIGQELEAEYGVRHLPSDFKKKNGYLRSVQLSQEHQLYRQDFCGCVYSKAQREREKRQAGV